MLFILMFTTLSNVESVALTDAVPDRTRPCDPFIVHQIRLNGHRVLARLLKDQDVVGQRWPRGYRILVQLHKQECLRVSANGLRLRILVDTDFAVVSPALLDELPDNAASEVAQADDAICRQCG